jgi:hypothetical protein
VAAPAALLLCLTAFDLDAQQLALGTGGIKGVVRDSAGLRLAGVQVVIRGSAARIETDEKGEFELAKVPAGPLTMQVRRLGFRPDTVDLMVMAGQVVPFEVVLQQTQVAISPVVVRGRSALSGWRAGFYARRDLGTGIFFTREDIEKRNPGMFTDMFRSIAGAQVHTNGTGIIRNQVRFRGAKCAPLVWLDGSPLGAGEFDLDVLSPYSIEAVEVYSGSGNAPMQYRVNSAIAPACGTIIVWSREGQRQQKRLNTSAAAALARAVETKQIFTAHEVDVAAREDSLHRVVPVYPDALHDGGVSGSVMAEFVVETSGEVNVETMSIVSSSHPLFAAAVQEALREAVYVPAIRGGYPVRQVVQHEFKFVPDSAGRRK